MSVIYILETIRNTKPECRFYSAGSSEEFGDVEFSLQTLEHLKPRSPYGASKFPLDILLRFIEKVMDYLRFIVYYLIMKV